MPMHQPPTIVHATQDVGDPDSHVERLRAVHADPAAFEPGRIGEIAAVGDDRVFGRNCAAREAAANPRECVGDGIVAALYGSPGAEECAPRSLGIAKATSGLWLSGHAP
jgi:hypothetical protein